MLSFAASWLHQTRIRTHALPDYSNFKKNREDDSALLRTLREFLDQADIVIAHNGDRFDLKKINTRLIVNGFKPPSPYRTIDTLKIARNVFGFSSNKLNSLCASLKIGRKLPHTGFHLWRSCMNGVKSAWPMMRRYNAHDVWLLRELYKIIRAWHPNHPDLRIYSGNTNSCPTCQSISIRKAGFHHTQKSKRQRYKCLSTKCGAWFLGELVK